MKIKPSRIGEITLSFTGEGKLCSSHVFLSFNSIRENRKITKVFKIIITRILRIVSKEGSGEPARIAKAFGARIGTKYGRR